MMSCSGFAVIKYEEVCFYAYEVVSEVSADIGDGGSTIKAEIHLTKRPKLFRHTTP